MRYQVLGDSLVRRERREETLELARQMKTLDKELLLKDEIGRLEEENSELNKVLNKTK